MSKSNYKRHRCFLPVRAGNGAGRPGACNLIRPPLTEKGTDLFSTPIPFSHQYPQTSTRLIRDRANPVTPHLITPPPTSDPPARPLRHQRKQNLPKRPVVLNGEGLLEPPAGAPVHHPLGKMQRFRRGLQDVRGELQGTIHEVLPLDHLVEQADALRLGGVDGGR